MKILKTFEQFIQHHDNSQPELHPEENPSPDEELKKKEEEAEKKEQEEQDAIEQVASGFISKPATPNE